MIHPLDNPGWSALRGPQAHLARGNSAALRYDAEHAVFAATKDCDPASLAQLGALIADTGPAIVLARGALPAVPGTRIAKRRRGVQMTAERLGSQRQSCNFIELGDDDAAEMLALATLTEPGPFFAKTHRLGRFIGVRDSGRLIAMAGERMKLDGFTEVSGVCTHPGYRGRGIAGALMHEVARRIVARGQIPFLHAYADNRGAIALYEALDFRLRCDVEVTVLEPER